MNCLRYWHRSCVVFGSGGSVRWFGGVADSVIIYNGSKYGRGYINPILDGDVQQGQALEGEAFSFSPTSGFVGKVDTQGQVAENAFGQGSGVDGGAPLVVSEFFGSFADPFYFEGGEHTAPTVGLFKTPFPVGEVGGLCRVRSRAGAVLGGVGGRCER